MTTTSTHPTWDPKTHSARHAETTENIQRAIAWIHGVLGVAITSPRNRPQACAAGAGLRDI